MRSQRRTALSIHPRNWKAQSHWHEAYSRRGASGRNKEGRENMPPHSLPQESLNSLTLQALRQHRYVTVTSYCCRAPCFDSHFTESALCIRRDRMNEISLNRTVLAWSSPSTATWSRHCSGFAMQGWCVSINVNKSVFHLEPVAKRTSWLIGLEMQRNPKHHLPSDSQVQVNYEPSRHQTNSPLNPKP